ncbi:hypothetical protein ACQ4PT_059235 [Festuca glaucescens]
MTGLHSRQYAYGRFYWITGWTDELLVLDTRRMEFSIVERPPGVRGFHSSANMSIMEQRISGGNSTQWQMAKTISIASPYSFICSLGRHLLLYQCGTSSIKAGCFTLDVKTFKLERVCASGPMLKTHTYCNFPPSILSSPTVSSGT